MAGAVGYGRLYSGCRPLRLCRGLSAGCALALALSAGGCSVSYQLDSFFGGDKAEVTGSIPQAARPAADLPPDGDLAYARVAASEVLKRNEQNASLPWENPKTGARGTVTPIASAYTQDGQTCRNFLASYVNGKSEAWFEGAACREAKGWEVRSLKPAKRS